MCFKIEFYTGFSENCKAPWLSSKTAKHGIPLPGIMKHQTCLKNNDYFTASPRATYSASEVESVTYFCVLENQHTHAPPHIIAPPDTDLLSVALLTESTSARTSKEIPTVAPRWYVMPKPQVPLKYVRIPSADFQWMAFGAEQYLATDRTALEISGRVEIAYHIKPPTGSRNDQLSVFSSSSNSYNLTPTLSGTL